jgi:hypothetical protein
MLHCLVRCPSSVAPISPKDFRQSLAPESTPVLPVNEISKWHIICNMASGSLCFDCMHDLIVAQTTWFRNKRLRHVYPQAFGHYVDTIMALMMRSTFGPLLKRKTFDGVIIYQTNDLSTMYHWSEKIHRFQTYRSEESVELIRFAKGPYKVHYITT